MNVSATPKEIAQLLMSSHLKKIFSGADTGTAECSCAGSCACSWSFKTDIKNAEDNEVRVQILLTIYNEMHQIWYDHPNVSEQEFIDILHKSFVTLGYELHITDPDTLCMTREEVIHYANISQTGDMYISPYHPFYTAYLISESGVELPESYKRLLQEPEVMPYIATYHCYSNGKMDIVTFSDLKD